jgi:hypothetical protein
MAPPPPQGLFSNFGGRALAVLVEIYVCLPWIFKEHVFIYSFYKHSLSASHVLPPSSKEL